ncbi:hypothetical protein EYC80_008083 [Monilinia laxa]|uniref:Uncharacterized protein n=1 Tax=Monilinia laxa TaxID=61186 RepID=A0A5N6JTE1_MONLA|nr:hypothetical protein EYC80_008083 [Monilinia laxa]
MSINVERRVHYTGEDKIICLSFFSSTLKESMINYHVLGKLIYIHFSNLSMYLLRRNHAFIRQIRVVLKYCGSNQSRATC